MIQPYQVIRFCTCGHKPLEPRIWDDSGAFLEDLTGLRVLLPTLPTPLDDSWCPNRVARAEEQPRPIPSSKAWVSMAHQ